MIIVAGLGNPGRRYAGTRHNLGHEVVRRLANELGVRFDDDGWASIARARLRGAAVLLVMPATYMNVSGQAVRDVLRRRRRRPEDLLVVHDDLDLAFGRLQLRPGNGPGGHNGVLSIIKSLGTRAFPRLRIGIGRPPVGVDPAEFVLERFTPPERAAMDDVVARAAEAVAAVAAQGLSAAMNEYNRRERDTPAGAS